MWRFGKEGDRRARRDGIGISSVFFVLLILMASASAVRAAQPRIERIRHFIGPDHTRIVLDLSAPASYEVRRVHDPERVAINVRRARFRATESIGIEGELVRMIRCNPGSARAQVVLDLAGKAGLKSFSLPAADGRPDRIVVDVFPDGLPGSEVAEPAVVAVEPSRQQPFTVVIDPGHGGIDPGAVAPGVREKDVVFDISREMARLINQLPGYRAVLTRETDFYPSLARRVKSASEADGDLFLSIHCNTHRNRAISGMEVYFLSLQGATDRESRELADKENAADLVGLDPQRRHSDLVMNILMDLRMSQVLHDSDRLAEDILAVTRVSGLIPGRKVKQARFQVLRSLAMPSALVEVGYLTNAEDLDLIKDAQWRRRMATNLVEGVLRWRRDEVALASIAPERPRGWTRKYRVARGDSLWKLARSHGTTVSEISRRNNLRSQAIMVGQLLRLPEGGGAP